MKLRIVSDGTPKGTRVLDENDELIERVTVADWHAAVGEIPTATLKLFAMPVDVIGEAKA
jgi:hypothetical protein